MITGRNIFNTVIIVFVLALMFLPLTTASLWIREALNSGHTVFFFFLSFYAYRSLRNQTNISKPHLIIMIVIFVGVLLGVLIEVVQVSLQREASVVDLYRDVMGIFAGLCLVASNVAKKAGAPVYRFFFLAVTVVLLLIALAPLMQLSRHYIQRNSAFPVVVDLGASWAGSFIEYNQAELLYGDEQNKKDTLYQVRFGPGLFPGISIREPVADWSSYRQLNLSVTSNMEEAVVLVLRVHDKQHNQDYSDRFNQALVVHPGINDYTLTLDSIREGPVARKLDLSEIAGIVLFLSRQSVTAQLFIGDLYLE
ncbi:hypothetical protein MNBD_GAMMA05-1236 [hydrothermal vent metagenome]|uniref:VanZ-like domain-containing protein n=1 Tax=hydrothermal vent metagenome TaxID=652676 RepID=A0A3B0WMZ5_9ZZZZ